jgi:hypothetical protein
LKTCPVCSVEHGHHGQWVGHKYGGHRHRYVQSQVQSARGCDKYVDRQRNKRNEHAHGYGACDVVPIQRPVNRMLQDSFEWPQKPAAVQRMALSRQALENATRHLVVEGNVDEDEWAAGIIPIPPAYSQGSGACSS